MNTTDTMLKKRKRAPKKDAIHYVDNKQFYEAIVAYRKKLHEARENRANTLPRMPDYIGLCIWKIAEKLSTSPSFINYSFRDEMVADGIENCILYFEDYDPEKGQNPFAYFTQVIYYAFLRRIYKEEKNRYAMYKNFQENIMGLNDVELLRDQDNNSLLPAQMYDNINTFMSKFEAKEEAKKQKRKAAKDNLARFYEDKNEQQD